MKKKKSVIKRALSVLTTSAVLLTFVAVPSFSLSAYAAKKPDKSKDNKKDNIVVITDINGQEHNCINVNEVKSDCKEDQEGCKEHYECIDCNKKLEKRTVGEKKDKKYYVVTDEELKIGITHKKPGKKEITGENASCTKTGLIEYTCTKCGKDVQEETALIPHDYKKIKKHEAKDPTRTEIGYQKGAEVCSICHNVKLNDKIIPAKDAISINVEACYQVEAPVNLILSEEEIGNIVWKSSNEDIAKIADDADNNIEDEETIEYDDVVEDEEDEYNSVIFPVREITEEEQNDPTLDMDEFMPAPADAEEQSEDESQSEAEEKSEDEEQSEDETNTYKPDTAEKLSAKGATIIGVSEGKCEVYALIGETKIAVFEVTVTAEGDEENSGRSDDPTDDPETPDEAAEPETPGEDTAPSEEPETSEEAADSETPGEDTAPSEEPETSEEAADPETSGEDTASSEEHETSEEATDTEMSGEDTASSEEPETSEEAADPETSSEDTASSEEHEISEEAADTEMSSEDTPSTVSETPDEDTEAETPSEDTLSIVSETQDEDTEAETPSEDTPSTVSETQDEDAEAETPSVGTSSEEPETPGEDTPSTPDVTPCDTNGNISEFSAEVPEGLGIDRVLIGLPKDPKSADIIKAKNGLSSLLSKSNLNLVGNVSAFDITPVKGDDEIHNPGNNIAIKLVLKKDAVKSGQTLVIIHVKDGGTPEIVYMCSYNALKRDADGNIIVEFSWGSFSTFFTVNGKTKPAPKISTTVIGYSVGWMINGRLEYEPYVDGAFPSYKGNIPLVKASDSEYSYTFDGWDKTLSPVIDNITYTAVWKKTPLKTEAEARTVPEPEVKPEVKPAVKPGKVTDVSVVNGVITWKAAENAVAYKIVKKVGGKTYYSQKINGTSYTLTNVPKSDYTVRIVSFSEDGSSTWGTTKTVKVYKSGVICTINGLKADKNGYVKWNAVNGAAAYKVGKIVNGKTSYSNMITSTKYKMASAPEGCEIFVVAFSANGTSTWGTKAKAAAPKATGVKMSADGKTVSWTKASGAVKYQVVKVVNGKKYYGSMTTSAKYTFVNAPKKGAAIYVIAFDKYNNPSYSEVIAA